MKKVVLGILAITIVLAGGIAYNNEIQDHNEAKPTPGG